MIEMNVDLEAAISAAMRRKYEAEEEKLREANEQIRMAQLQRDAEAIALVTEVLGVALAEALVPIKGSTGDRSAYFEYHGVRFRMWRANDAKNPVWHCIGLDVDNENEAEYITAVHNADDILAYIGERVNPAYYRALSEGGAVDEDGEDG